MANVTKMKTITLSDGHAPNGGVWLPIHTEKDSRFRVQKITDSVQFRTGQLLERTAVEELCAASDWKVFIVPI